VSDRVGLVGLDRQLPPRIAGEAAVAVQPYRPDLGMRSYGIVDPPVVGSDGPDAALVLGEAPGARILRVEGGVLDVHRLAISGERREAMRRAAGEAVIERVDQRAVRADAVDEAAVEVGGEELAAALVKGDVADAGAAVRDGRKQRHRARGAVDL